MYGKPVRKQLPIKRNSRFRYLNLILRHQREIMNPTLVLHELENRKHPYLQVTRHLTLDQPEKSFIVVKYIYIYVRLYEVCCEYQFTLMTHSI